MWRILKPFAMKIVLEKKKMKNRRNLLILQLVTPDGITDGVIHVFANVVEVAARGTDATLLGKEVSFIMHMEYLASTFHLAITYGKFVTQHLVQFVEEQVYPAKRNVVKLKNET